MSLNEIKRFTKDLKGSAELQSAIKGAGASPEAVAGVAKEKGYDFTAEELKAAAAENKGEMSEEQLDKVAGGAVIVEVTGTTVVVEVTVVAT